MGTNRKQLLYIGNKASVLMELIQLPKKNMDVRHIKSRMKAYLWLQKANNIPSIILVDTDNGEDDVIRYCTLLNERFSRYQYIQFVLFSHENYKIDRESLLLQNIIEVFPTALSKVQRERLLSIVLREKKNGLRPLTTPDKRQNFGIPFWKRAFDVLASGTALLVLSPLLLLIAILIKIDTEGPVFYISKRVGRGFMVFDFYKFRTMKVAADKELDVLKKNLNQYVPKDAVEVESSCQDCVSRDCPKLFIDGEVICEQQFLASSKMAKPAFVKLQNDPRITRLGRFLRNTSLDELPQLFNILKGDMSVVGNRPVPLYEAEQLTTDQAVQRFAAPAGLTGLWQVRKRGKRDMSDDERKQLDNAYAKDYSLGMDVQLIFKTLAVFVQRENV